MLREIRRRELLLHADIRCLSKVIVKLLAVCRFLTALKAEHLLLRFWTLQATPVTPAGSKDGEESSYSSLTNFRGADEAALRRTVDDVGAKNPAAPRSIELNEKTISVAAERTTGAKPVIAQSAPSCGDLPQLAYPPEKRN